MLAVLLESRAARPRRTGSTLLSAGIHGALIAGVVALALPGRGSARSTPDARSPRLTFVIPTAAAAPSAHHASATIKAEPSGPTLPVIATLAITPADYPPIDLSLPATAASEIRVGSRSDIPGSTITSPGLPSGGTGDPAEVSAVDRAPALSGRAPEPRYPPALRAAGVEGRVLAEFVVDTLGHAELATLRFPQLPDPRFGDAVREALTHYRFSPGEVAGRKVRTRAVMPFDFRLVGGRW